MTVQLPDPPLPASVNLRDFRRMPLDVARLRDSDIAREDNAEGFRCAVLAWCVAWHQVPAASLPDDDRALADLIGIGRTPRAVKEWQALRAVALRGFKKHSDGRLYHGVVVEMAIEAWGAQLTQRWKTACSRIKKQQQRAKQPINLPPFGLWINAECPEAKPFMSRWTKHHVLEDGGPGPEGQPPHVPDPSPRKTPPMEGKGREGIEESKDRCGDGDIPAPRAAAEAVGPHTPTSTPEATAKIIAECARAKIHEPEQDPIVARWIRIGATPTQVVNSIVEGVKSRDAPNPMTSKYVDPILMRTMDQDRKARAAQQRKHEETQATIAEGKARLETMTAPPEDVMGKYRKRAAA